ncbi:helix-turn-helix domain-containing protein [Streptomyces sp. NPDC018031]|uniref:helix-turn-helix domain-containing protein n=1 Tax=Streptomyces sp. NPDC018031 TaxID=3365033 RepID=UPI003799D94B
MTFQPHELSPGRSVRDLFGAEMRHHREKAGLSLRRLSEVLKYSKSQLARYEAADSLPYDDLPGMLDACFGTDGLFARLHEAAKREPFPGKYRRVMDIESRAIVIEEYSGGAVPGLLQTSDLAECWLRCGRPHAPEAETKAMVKSRIDRQVRLQGPKPPRCWFIVDEAVLRRPVGGPEVMRRQMASLIERGTQSHITLQVLPFLAGEHPQVLGGSLTLYTLPGQAAVAYEESARSSTILEDHDHVMECRESYDLLRAMALPPRDSEAVIRTAMEDWTRCDPPRT